MITIVDRGLTKGHRYLVVEGRKRLAVFDIEGEAEKFVEGTPSFRKQMLEGKAALKPKAKQMFPTFVKKKGRK